MLTKSRCLPSLCAAGLIALASQSTAFAQGNTTIVQPAPAAPAPAPAAAPAPAPAPAPVATQPEAPKANANVNVNTNSQPNRYVDTEENYSWPNRRMLGSAAALLTISYVPSVIVAAAGNRAEDDNLFIPFAGPWMYMRRHEHDPGSKALLSIDGILQDLGGLELLLSFVVPQQEKRRWYELGKNDIRVLPRVSPYNAGLSAGGHF